MDSLVASAEWRAAGIASALALPPGPLGMLTILPDLYAIWRIQSQLVADIAAVYDKTAKLGHQEMLYCLFRHGAAQAFRDIVLRVGERVLVRQTSLRGLQKVIERVGVRVTQRVLGETVSRWLPIIGAVGIGWYAKYDTHAVGESAREFFSCEIDIEPLETPQ